MSTLHFRIDGGGDDDLSVSWRRPRARLAPPFRLLLAMIVAFGLARSGRLESSRTHVALIHGTEVRANRVLLLLDGSGSMSAAADTPANIQYQLQRLVSAGIAVEARAVIPGFAIATRGQYSLLDTFHERVRTSRTIDAVYVISDFAANDDEANDRAALASFERTLRSRGLRLYWATVRNQPGPAYRELALRSGGAVVPLERGET